jgi:hypothetical protein
VATNSPKKAKNNFIFCTLATLIYTDVMYAGFAGAKNLPQQFNCGI